MPSHKLRKNSDYFAIDDDRKVLQADFGGPSHVHHFCERYKVDSILEAILQSEEAALEFVKNFKEFQSIRDDELTEALCTSINAYDSIAPYFLDNTDEFVDLTFFRQVYTVATIKERQQQRAQLRLVVSNKANEDLASNA